jgi:peptidoglycan-N-acetylglucosamine deacetylase
MFRYNTPQLMPWLVPSIIWKMPQEGKNIYLTFDDGPHPEITPWVMDELDKHNAKGTFFCVGDNVRKFPATFDEVLSRGHRIGNHTHNHISGWATDNKAYLNNIALCDEYTQTNLFRPPYGKIGPMQLREVRKKYKVVYWSILSRDFEATLDVQESLAYMLENTGDGAIVLFHDSVKAEKNLKALLPRFLEHFAAQGYSFLAIE